jgi:hypothetical protein
MPRLFSPFLSKNQRDRVARAATEELAPKLDGKRVFISVDRSGKVSHRPARSTGTVVSRMRILERPLKAAKLSNGKIKIAKVMRQTGPKRASQKALVETVRLIAGTD